MGSNPGIEQAVRNLLAYGAIDEPPPTGWSLGMLGYQKAKGSGESWKVLYRGKVRHLAPKFETVQNVRFSPFRAADDVINLLKENLRGISQSPGLDALQSINAQLVSAGMNPTYRVSGLGAGRPSVQMSLGGQVMNLPFERTAGEVIHGRSVLAARGTITAQDRFLSYSQTLVANMRDLGSHVDDPRAVKGVIRATNRRLTEAATYQGNVLTSVVEARSHQYVFDKGHELSRAHAENRALSVDMLKSVTSGRVGDIESTYNTVNRQNEALMQGILDKGLHIEGLKPETWKNHLVASKGSLALLPGIYHSKIAKGNHQLLQREILSGRGVDRWWGGRSFPRMVAPGYTNQYEIASNVLAIGGRGGETLLGDSGYVVGSERMAKLHRMFRPAGSLSVEAPLVHGANGAQLGEMRLGPMFNRIMNREIGGERVADILAREGSVTLPRGLRFNANGTPIVVGQHTSLDRMGDVVTGRTVRLRHPEDVALKRIEMHAGEKSAQLRFVFRGRSDQFRVGSVGGLLNGGRLSASGAVLTKGAPIDMIARSADVFGDIGRMSNQMGGHWASLAKTGRVPTSELAKVMGVQVGASHGNAVLVGAHDWRATEGMAGEVEALFRRHGRNDLASQVRGSPIGRRRGLRIARDLSRQRGMNLKDLGNEALQDVLDAKVFRAGAFSIRSRTGSGFKNRSGVRLRLDQFMATLKQMSMDPSTSQDLARHAQGLMQQMVDRNPALMEEAFRLWGPAFEAGRNVSGTRIMGISEFAKMSAPGLSGGVTEGMLAGTALSPNFGGAYVDLGQEIKILTGTRGGKNASRYLRSNMVWVPSSSLSGVRVSPNGQIYVTPQMRAVDRFQSAVREMHSQGGTNLNEIEVLANRMLMATRSQLLGKKGMLSLQARPLGGANSRVHLLSNRADDAYTIAMTKQRLRRIVGRKNFGKIYKMAASSEGFMASGGRWPIKGPGGYLPGLKLRVLEGQELANHMARAKKAGVSGLDLIRVGQAAAWSTGTDQDLDTFFTIINADPKEQALLRRINQKNTDYFRFYNDVVKRAYQPEDALALRLAEKSGLESVLEKGGTLTDAIVQGRSVQHQNKLGVAIPEVFFRSRGEVGAWAFAASTESGVPGTMKLAFGKTPAEFIRRIGADKLLQEGSQLTRNEAASMFALSEMYSQEFLQKESKGTFRIMKEIVKLRDASKAGGRTFIDQIGNLQAAMGDLLGGLKPEKIRGPMLAEIAKMGVDVSKIENVNDFVARNATNAFAKVEPAMGEQHSRFLLSAMTQGRSKEKSGAALEVLYGPMEQGNYADAELTRLVRGTASEEIGNINRMIRETTEGLEGPAARKGWRGYLGAGMDLLADTWGGHTMLGKVGGRAALIGGGLLVAKGMIDAFSPQDDISAMDRPMPAPVSAPIGSMSPSWALPSTPIRLESPQRQPFRIRGTTVDEGFPGAIMATSVVNRLSRNPAYGYVEDQNVPMTDSELRYHLEKRERSSF